VYRNGDKGKLKRQNAAGFAQKVERSPSGEAALRTIHCLLRDAQPIADFSGATISCGSGVASHDNIDREIGESS